MLWEVLRGCFLSPLISFSSLDHSVNNDSSASQPFNVTHSAVSELEYIVVRTDELTASLRLLQNFVRSNRRQFWLLVRLRFSSCVFVLHPAFHAKTERKRKLPDWRLRIFSSAESVRNINETCVGP